MKLHVRDAHNKIIIWKIRKLVAYLVWTAQPFENQFIYWQLNFFVTCVYIFDTVNLHHGHLKSVCYLMMKAERDLFELFFPMR